MSKTVDERLVEMRFDNQNFEKNTAQSMRTLDKLKTKLNFKDSSKSLESLEKASRNVTFEKMANSVATLEKRFSVTGIVGMRVIENLTDSAMGLIKKLQNFVVSGIKSGGLSRAMKLENAQFQLGVLLKDADKVTAVMKNVSAAVDGTAYSLDAAATVASQLAASGIEAGDKMQQSLQAVAGVAAMTNSSYEDIGRIFTQIAGQGRLMGNDLLQLSGRGMNAAATLGEALGKTEAEIRDMVSKGKISFEVFSNVMYQSFGEGAKKANETFDGALSNVKSALARIGALFYSPLIASNGPVVKFLNVVREKINDVKKYIEPIAKIITDKLIVAIEWFTNLVSKIDIDGLLGKFKKIMNPFDDLWEKIKKIIGATDDAKAATKELGDVVDRVINGDFKNAPERWQKLTEAGYDWAYVQNLVNERLGSSVRHATDYTEAQEGVNAAQRITLDQLLKMTDAQLKALGFTDEEIKALRELQRQSEKTGIPIEELIKDMDKLSGKFLILDSFKNIGYNIKQIFTSIGKAFKETFRKKDTDGVLYNLIAGFHKLTVKLRITDEQADKLKRTFKGVFSVFAIVGETIRSLVAHIAKGIGSIAKALNPPSLHGSLLDHTAKLGDSLYELKVKLVDNGGIDKAFDKVGDAILKFADAIKKAIEKIKEFFKFISNTGPVTKFKEVIKSIDFKNIIPNLKNLIKQFGEFLKLDKVFDKLKNVDLRSVGKNIIEGLKNGLESGKNLIPQILIDIGKKILDAIKGVLGIHSPSRKMFEVGQNIIQGLINGIKDNKDKVLDIFKNIGQGIVTFFQNFPWRQVLAGGIVAGAIYAGKRVLDIIDKFAAPFEGVGAVLDSVAGILGAFKENLANFFKSINKVIKAEAFKMRMEGILDFAKAIAIVAASLVVLSKIDTKSLWKSIGAVGALAGILIAVAIVMDNLTKTSASIEKGKFNFDGLKTGMIALGIALFLVARVVKTIGEMNPEQAKQGFKGLLVIVGALAGVLVAFAFLGKKVNIGDIVKVGKMLRQLSITLLILVVVLKLISKMTWPDMGKAAAFMGGFIIFVGALVKVTKIDKSQKIAKLGKLLMSISVAMLLMVAVMKLAAKLKPNEIIAGLGFMSAFVIFVWALVEVTKVDKGSQVAKLGGLLLSISFSMLLMVAVMKLVGKLSMGDIGKGLLFMGSFVLFVGALTKVASVSKGKEIAKLSGILLSMSIAIAIMAGVCIILGYVDAHALKKGITAVGFLSAFMAGMIKAVNTGNDAAKSARTFASMAVAIGVMAASVIALSLLEPGKLAGATAALGILVTVFGIAARLSKDAKGSAKSLIVMTVAIGLLATMLLLLAQLPVEQSLGAAISLSAVLIAMTVAMKVIQTSGKINPTVLVSVGIMAAAILAIGGILYLLKDMDPTSALGNAAALSLLLVSLSACCVLLAAAGMGGPAALVGVAALSALIGAVGGIMVALGALTEHFPKMEEFMDKGLAILEKIGYGLGSFFGNIVGGFTAGATSGLPEIGTNLSDFMDNLSGFIDGAKNIDETAMNGVKSLVSMLGMISAQNILEGISKWLTGESSMDVFKERLEGFADAITGFSDKVKDHIDEPSVTAAANAGKALAELNKSLPNTGGLLQKLIGIKDMGEFSNKLQGFGEAIVEFSSKVEGHVNEEAVQAAANAGQVLVELNKALPSTDGLLQKLTGQKDLSLFASQMTAFGGAITAFSSKVEGNINGDAVQAAANAGSILVELNKSIPNSGGVVDFFTGKNDLGTFGNNLKTYGTALSAFSESIKDVNAEAISNSANAVKKLVDVSAEIGVFTFTGVSGFSSVVTIGNGLKNYAEKISGVNFETVKNSISPIKSLVNLVKSIGSIDSSGVQTFSSAINTLGKTNFTGLTKALAGSSSDLSSSGAKLVESLAKGLKSKTSSISNAGKHLVKELKNSLDKNANEMTTVGTKTADNFANGVNKSVNKAAQAFAKVLTSCVSTIRGYYTSFYNAGSYLASGLASGISANSYKVSAQAKAMANAAYNVAKRALDINSPSKVFRRLGYSVPEGFAQGIDRMGKVVSGSSKGMAQLALENTKSAISRIGELVDSGMNVQPTIRPVVDMSNVNAGVSAISSMMNLNGSVNVMTNARAISLMRRSKIQNGTNQEVVSAIDKLRNDIGNINNNSYTINGITYDGGSDVAEAIETIVRAARIERRA